MLKLYGLLVVGLVLTWIAPVLTVGGGPVFVFVGMVVALASLAAVLSGGVGIAYKVLTDVRTADGESS